jgi:hypothetical protein
MKISLLSSESYPPVVSRDDLPGTTTVSASDRRTAILVNVFIFQPLVIGPRNVWMSLPHAR